MGKITEAAVAKAAREYRAALRFAKDPQKAAARVLARLGAKADEAKIAKAAEKLLAKADGNASRAFFLAAQKRMAVPVARSVLAETTAAFRAQFAEETAKWVAKLQADSITYWTARSVAAIEAGTSLDTVVSEELDGFVEKRRNHARFLARNQVQNYHALAGKIRAEALGITRAIWRTSQDDAVRPSHADRDGQEFDLADGLYSPIDGLSLLPGVDFNCRCVAEYVVPTE